MSDFILNIARRSAGLGFGALVEPNPEPVFLPGLNGPDLRTQSDFPNEQLEGEVQSWSAMPARHQKSSEAGQDVRHLGDEQSRPPIVDELRAEPAEIKPAPSTDEMPPKENILPGSVDRLPGFRGVVVRTLFGRGSIRRPLDHQVSEFQPAVELRASADVADRVEHPNSVEFAPQEPPQAPGSFQTRLTLQKRSIPEGHEEPFRAAQSSEPSKASFQPSDSQSDRIKRSSEDTPRTIVEPVPPVVGSSSKLLSGSRPPDHSAVTPLRQQIRVRIGTIEVRAEPASGHRAPALKSPQSGFDDYNFIR